MKKVFLVGVMVVVLLVLTGCAPGPNVHLDQSDPDGELAGFWQGLWQGFISGFTFIISLFNDNVNVYEVHNNGGWYNFGFMIGVSSFFGGSGRGTKRSRWKSED